MLLQNCWYHRGLAAMAASLLFLQGCGHFGLPADPVSTAPAENSGPALSGHESADIQVALGRNLETRGQIEQAVANYSAAVKHDPKRSDAFLRLAIVHDQQGKFDQSAVYYRKALQARPGDADIYADMGYSLYLQRRWAESEMNLRQAIALKPNHARAHNNLGLLLARMNRTEEALAEFQKGGCSPADARSNLAFALASEGRLEEGQSQYQAAVSADQSSSAARKGLLGVDRLLAKMRRQKEVPSANAAPSVQAQPTSPAVEPPINPWPVSVADSKPLPLPPAESPPTAITESKHLAEPPPPLIPTPEPSPAEHVVGEHAPKRLPFRSDLSVAEDKAVLPISAPEPVQGPELTLTVPETAPEEGGNQPVTSAETSFSWWWLALLPVSAGALFLGIYWRRKANRGGLSHHRDEAVHDAGLANKPLGRLTLTKDSFLHVPNQTAVPCAAAGSDQALKNLMAELESPRYRGRYRAKVGIASPAPAGKSQP